ncbi:hypothetical protein CXB51_030914 [Gossypium anomalum]|uniref:Uncharacterized protein n=1 Tax=Gossypium anomalum TaxID=47600 RepID=A0A8J5Y5D0_9ROSI|nr:hypothetical protein CXB51_030914 [Gossypium anomalum]
MGKFNSMQEMSTREQVNHPTHVVLSQPHLQKISHHENDFVFTTNPHKAFAASQEDALTLPNGARIGKTTTLTREVKHGENRNIVQLLHCFFPNSISICRRKKPLIPWRKLNLMATSMDPSDTKLISKRVGNEARRPFGQLRSRVGKDGRQTMGSAAHTEWPTQGFWHGPLRLSLPPLHPDCLRGVAALCSVDDDPNAKSSNDVVAIDPSRVKVSIEYGLCEMLNKQQLGLMLRPKMESFVSMFHSSRLCYQWHGRSYGGTREGVGVSVSAFKEDTDVIEVDYCAYSELTRQCHRFFAFKPRGDDSDSSEAYLSLSS